LVGGYQNFDGVMRPTKLTVKRNGQEFLDMELSGYRAYEKVNERIFDEPVR
jgi:hypothetical protein